MIEKFLLYNKFIIEISKISDSKVDVSCSDNEFLIGDLNLTTINSHFLKFMEFITENNFLISAVTVTSFRLTSASYLFSFDGNAWINSDRTYQKPSGVVIYIYIYNGIKIKKYDY